MDVTRLSCEANFVAQFGRLFGWFLIIDREFLALISYFIERHKQNKQVAALCVGCPLSVTQHSARLPAANWGAPVCECEAVGAPSAVALNSEPLDGSTRSTHSRTRSAALTSTQATEQASDGAQAAALCVCGASPLVCYQCYFCCCSVCFASSVGRRWSSWMAFYIFGSMK